MITLRFARSITFLSICMLMALLSARGTPAQAIFGLDQITTNTGFGNPITTPSLTPSQPNELAFFFVDGFFANSNASPCPSTGASSFVTGMSASRLLAEPISSVASCRVKNLKAGRIIPMRRRGPQRAATPPTDLDFEKALMFFHAYMNGPLQGKLRLYNAREVHPPGAAMSSDWEVFASILVRDVGKKLAAGVDLSGHEVKSAFSRGSYEYQYHRNTGKKKLRRDMEVGHLFFNHWDNLRHVELRFAHGSSMRAFFRKWLKGYPDPYPQRYRKNIPFLWVKKHGVLLMTLTDGEVTYPELASAPKEHT